MGQLIWELRYGLRTLRKSPGFTAVAVLTLALGIGATTAIFTLIQQVMLRSLVVTRPDQLWRIGDSDRCCFANGYTQGNGDDLSQNNWNFFSWEAYKQLRANTPAFENLAAFQVGEANAHLAVRRAGSSIPVETRNGEYVSGNFFQTFGILAWRGRLLTDADDQENAPPVAVMSFRVWQAKYGADPSVAGGTYDINGHPFTVIGIAAPDFFGAKIDSEDMPDFWLPLSTEPLIAGASSRLKNPRLAWLDLIGRVRPDTNPKTLETQLQVELHQWLASHVPDMRSQEKALLQRQTLRLTPGGAGVSPMREKYKDGLRLLLLAAACVLLVACGNVANLLLARGLRQRQQAAIRVTLGASRGRLVRNALIESLLLAVIGGAVGIAVAYAGAGLILHLAFSRADTWVPVDATPSTAVLLFALAVSVITGVIFGIAPAWMASDTKPIEAMRGASRTVGFSRSVFGGAGTQKILVVMQASVSLVLLSAATMLGQSLRNLEHQNIGFDPGERYVVSIAPKISGYKQEQLLPLLREIEHQLRLVPGIRGAGSVLAAPLTSWVWPHDIQVEGKPADQQDDVSSGWTRVTPGFFDSLGNRIVIGRAITDDDNEGTRPVAVINEAFARKFFGNEDPIGQHFGPSPGSNSGMYEIIGVVADVSFGSDLQKPMYFLPEAQSTSFVDQEAEEREVLSHYLSNVVIWAPKNRADFQANLKKTLAKAAPNLVVNSIQPYAEIIQARFAQQNMIASLTRLFGAVGLLLAAVGLYGVTAYRVEKRTKEIGVRMALGADRGSVVLMVLREAFWMVGAGLALGIPAAIGAGNLIASQLFGVRPRDPLMLSVAVLLLGVASLIAAAIPARRATRVEPMIALRYE
ncbi:MAG TPA: ABC transporter permease [Candidatus Angelobacter sp.]